MELWLRFPVAPMALCSLTVSTDGASPPSEKDYRINAERESSGNMSDYTV